MENALSALVTKHSRSDQAGNFGDGPGEESLKRSKSGVKSGSAALRQSKQRNNSNKRKDDDGWTTMDEKRSHAVCATACKPL
jgi:hypothetical protein